MLKNKIRDNSITLYNIVIALIIILAWQCIRFSFMYSLDYARMNIFNITLQSYSIPYTKRLIELKLMFVLLF